LINQNQLSAEFKRQFGIKPEIYLRSPGRVNLIGEHVDYHDGYVMPAAIDLGIDWAVAKNNLNKVRGISLNTKEKDQFSIESLTRVKTQWLQYLQGVVAVLRQDKKNFGGIDIIIHGNLPIGSGLSSSSSLVIGSVFALANLYGLNLSQMAMTDIGCRAEWWYGTRGGNMDHFAISHGQKNKAMFFDIRNLTFEYLPITENLAIVIFETTIRHNQKSSPFAQRRQEAEKALKILQKTFPGQKINKLRDVNHNMLKNARSKLDDLSFRRALHVVSENRRVLSTRQAFKKHNLTLVGKNLASSHQSLRDNYQVSCRQLDIAVAEANKIKGLIASRMTGGGFGGCTVNLVVKDQAEDFAQQLSIKFQQKTGLSPKVYICQAAAGVKLTGQF